jgi:hypothetical protein
MIKSIKEDRIRLSPHSRRLAAPSLKKRPTRKGAVTPDEMLNLNKEEIMNGRK